VISPPGKLDVAVVTRLRKIVAGEPATESELRAEADRAGAWAKAHSQPTKAIELRGDRVGTAQRLLALAVLANPPTPSLRPSIKPDLTR
jgi:hypothetical protein